MARALVGAGFIPCLGFHHSSQTNPFNLADDLIEPFRPCVDTMVFSRCADRDPSSDLTIDDRRMLAGLPLETIRIDGADFSVLAAAEHCVASLIKATDANDPSMLVLPTIASVGAVA